jgi:outer membrane protein TolC
MASSFAAALLAALSAAAQTNPAPEALSLSDAIAIAQTASPDLATANFRARAAEEQATAASLFWAPDLSLDSGWDRTELPSRVFAQKLNRGAFTSADFAIGRLNDPAFDSNLETTLGLHLALDLFGSSRAATRAAEAGARAEGSRARAAQGDLSLEVMRVYLGILTADRSRDAAEKSLAAARELETAVELRREAGAVLPADVLRVRTRRRDREVDVARARSDAELGRSRLRVLLGWPRDGAIELSSSAPEAEALDRPLGDWIAAAAAHSPELEAASAAAAIPREVYRRERLSTWPAVQLFGGYQDERNSFSGGKGSTTVEVRLHWNLWDAGRTSRLSAARYGARASDEMRKSAENAVRLEVEARWRDLEVARLESEAVGAGRREAEEVYRVTRERWEAGKAALVDVLDAEGAAAGAAAAEAKTAARVAMVRASLRRAAGEI